VQADELDTARCRAGRDARPEPSTLSVCDPAAALRIGDLDERPESTLQAARGARR
jgi:hypothetical protein